MLALLVSSAHAMTYRAPIDNSIWRLEASVFECRLSHAIPSYGEAVFSHRAGERVSFYLDSWHRPMRQGKAEMTAQPPSWRIGSPVREMGAVKVVSGRQPVAIKGSLPSSMLAQLYGGMQPTIHRLAWYDSKQPVNVELSPVNFQVVYQQYVSCLSQLLPVNFDQIQRSFVLFDTGKTQLRQEALQKLGNIITYVKADPSVSTIFIDGHTDNRGRRLANRELSKERAEVVRDYLQKRGLPTDMILLRFHGERYPVVSNNTAANRARNRRVTIRLEKEENFDT
ncbi:OmpA family protein [Aestuariirhabdus sp. Z084]|uniref:flagellar protein MotY n=1 Tax=Aestuariirhabdus haliotis TaxID=2918751 RepID=UPI00201B37CA|nr:OmpA family protein [Aestuariirhabdus haliotis]MCL6416287.1 OmpA family protein [Aestuariirhabdus haliotis]MCL6420160.1 OmpA family protein [Aestuariirhabdus haliotis]